MKFCKNKLCEQVNPQEESNFHKYSASKDGLNKYCKSCMKKKVGYINKTDRKNSKHKEYSMWTGKEEKDFKEVYSDMSLKELQKKFNKSESAIKNKARELNISKISYVNKPISIHKISFPDKCGVYAIKNNANNKIYIGSTHNLQQRIEKHIHDLKNNKHGNKDLQKDYNNNNNDFVCWIVYLGEDYKNTEEKIINGYFKYLYNKTRYTTIKKHDFKETYLKKIEYIGDCWLWKGNINNDGYGIINKKLAHRLFYTKYKKEIKHGNIILHKCNNKLCVNPDHLEEGNDKENCKDRTLQRNSKLGITYNMVQNIRKRKLSGEKVVDIQKDYSFNIKGIVYNQSWYDKDYVGYKRGGG